MPWDKKNAITFKTDTLLTNISRLPTLYSDRPSHNFKASKSGDQQILCRSEMSGNGFRSSKFVKGSVGICWFLESVLEKVLTPPSARLCKTEFYISWCWSIRLTDIWTILALEITSPSNLNKGRGKQICHCLCSSEYMRRNWFHKAGEVSYKYNLWCIWIGS